MAYPITITPARKLEFPDFGEIREYKDLMFLLVQRDLKVRFQQTFIGVFWIILQPVIQMLISYVIFGVLVRVPTEGVPYSVFYLSGFVVWQLFLQVVNSSAYSLVANIPVITKTYFPRLALPLSTTIGAMIDFAISFGLLLAILLINHYPITIRFLSIFLLLAIALIFSLGVGLLFGALMVVFRDTKNLLGFILQIWMFITPIIYPVSIAPPKYRFIFYVNPVTGVIDAFRWAVLNSPTFPSLSHLAVSAAGALICIVVGLLVFRYMENQVADVM